MTPQEKAKELVYKYKDAPFNCLGCDMPYCDIPCTMLNIEESKKCALITVDEILELTKRPTYNPFDWNEVTGVRYDKYWLEVKQEIERL